MSVGLDREKGFRGDLKGAKNKEDNFFFQWNMTVICMKKKIYFNFHVGLKVSYLNCSEENLPRGKWYC